MKFVHVAALVAAGALAGAGAEWHMLTPPPGSPAAAAPSMPEQEPLHRAPARMAEDCRRQGKVFLAWRQDYDTRWAYECLEPRVARWYKEQKIPH